MLRPPRTSSTISPWKRHSYQRCRQNRWPFVYGPAVREAVCCVFGSGLVVYYDILCIYIYIVCGSWMQPAKTETSPEGKHIILKQIRIEHVSNRIRKPKKRIPGIQQWISKFRSKLMNHLCKNIRFEVWDFFNGYFFYSIYLLQDVFVLMTPWLLEKTSHLSSKTSTNVPWIKAAWRVTIKTPFEFCPPF